MATLINELRLDRTTLPLSAIVGGDPGNSGKAADAKHRHDLSNIQKAFAQDCTLVILLPSGTVNASGLFTLGTALSLTPAGTVKVYVGSGVGLVAGLYAATFSDTTHCQLTGSPATTAGAYTAPTSECILASFTLPGSTLGLHGMLDSDHRFTGSVSGNNKTYRAKLGSTAFFTTVQTSLPTMRDCRSICNAGSQGVQTVMPAGNMTGGTGTTSATPTQLAVDTSADTVISYAAQLANSTDWIILLGYSACATRSPQG